MSGRAGKSVPERLEQLWIEQWNYASDEVRDLMLQWGYLCAEGEAPRKVGTPAEDVAPPAE